MHGRKRAIDRTSRRHVRSVKLPLSASHSALIVMRDIRRRPKNASVAAGTRSQSHRCHSRPLAIEDAPAPSCSSPRFPSSFRTSPVRRRPARRPRLAAHSEPCLLRQDHLPHLEWSSLVTLFDRILQVFRQSRRYDLCGAITASVLEFNRHRSVNEAVCKLPLALNRLSLHAEQYDTLFFSSDQLRLRLFPSLRALFGCPPA